MAVKEESRTLLPPWKVPSFFHIKAYFCPCSCSFVACPEKQSEQMHVEEKKTKPLGWSLWNGETEHVKFHAYLEKSEVGLIKVEK